MSATQDFLRLLEAPTCAVLEDRVVQQINDELRKQLIADVLPIRLSKIAESLLIRPTPEIVPGNHDGQIEFEPKTGRFVIRLCQQTDHTRAGDLRFLPRLRFTYAHEMAHRFFFVKHSTGWIRAVEAATSHLSSSSAMRERITINRIEEGLCNAIARRVLIPDCFLDSKCRLADWFLAEGHLFAHLWRGARTFGVSVDCLLVRLQKEVTKGRTDVGHNCLFVVSPSRGNITNRGRVQLRVTAAIMPPAIGDFSLKRIYPGYAWENFGPEALHSVTGIRESRGASFGAMRYRLQLSGSRGDEATNESFELQGWWRASWLNSEENDKKVIVWGKLAPIRKKG